VESQFLGDYTRPSLEMLCNETQSMNASQTNASQTNDLSVVCCASFDTCEALSDDGKQIAYTMRGMVLAEDDDIVNKFFKNLLQNGIASVTEQTNVMV